MRINKERMKKIGLNVLRTWFTVVSMIVFLVVMGYGVAKLLDGLTLAKASLGWVGLGSVIGSAPAATLVLLLGDVLNNLLVKWCKIKID